MSSATSTSAHPAALPPADRPVERAADLTDETAEFADMWRRTQPSIGHLPPDAAAVANAPTADAAIAELHQRWAHHTGARAVWLAETLSLAGPAHRRDELVAALAHRARADRDLRRDLARAANLAGLADPHYGDGALSDGAELADDARRATRWHPLLMSR